MGRFRFDPCFSITFYLYIAWQLPHFYVLIQTYVKRFIAENLLNLHLRNASKNISLASYHQDSFDRSIDLIYWRMLFHNDAATNE